jgi:succinate dehydrogenase / fumarate reductase cytochrome b subunit
MTTTETPPTAGTAETPPPAPATPRVRGLGRARTPIGRMYATGIGKKWVMAITGLILMSFLVVHLLGNIKLYLSKEELNLYGEALRDMPGHLHPRTWLLWGFRIGQIAAFFFHIHAAYGLTRINMKARPEKYQSKRDYIAADFASRTMRWTGIIILLYLIFHLADLTWGSANSEFLRGDPYNNLVYSLQRPVVAIAYGAAMIALGFHLYHGSWSLFQSLGINNPRYNRGRRLFAIGFAVVIAGGNLIFPIAVQAGWVGLECPHTEPTTISCPE